LERSKSLPQIYHLKAKEKISGQFFKKVQSNEKKRHHTNAAPTPHQRRTNTVSRFLLQIEFRSAENSL
jgi:hypothetical protein